MLLRRAGLTASAGLSCFSSSENVTVKTLFTKAIARKIWRSFFGPPCISCAYFWHASIAIDFRRGRAHSTVRSVALHTLWSVHKCLEWIVL